MREIDMRNAGCPVLDDQLQVRGKQSLLRKRIDEEFHEGEPEMWIRYHLFDYASK